MLTFTIGHAAAYSYAMRVTYTAPRPLLSLVVSGLDLFSYPGQTLEHAAPLLLLIPQGTAVSFDFSPKRLNYGVLLDRVDIRMGNAHGIVEIRNHGNWTAMPMVKTVEAGALREWRNRFEQIVEAHRAPSPSRTLRAEAHVVSAILWLLDTEAAPVPRTPAGRLKALIETDPAGRESLEKLCARCRYSSDHLRVLFEREFGMTPKAYRERCRMTRAMELIGRSTLSIKEIADRLGFTHASHFSTVFRATIGITPREAIRSHRGTNILASYDRFPPTSTDKSRSRNG
ncbi:MAG: helix-turn-helix transcriptional regulator [Phycisphaeraceae bacterium]|nr:helix-turn-helix transcriptional regulator [Phycisphaeraceae bacterium]